MGANREKVASFDEAERVREYLETVLTRTMESKSDLLKILPPQREREREAVATVDGGDGELVETRTRFLGTRGCSD